MESFFSAVATSLKRGLYGRQIPVNFAKFFRTTVYRTSLGDCFWSYWIIIYRSEEKSWFDFKEIFINCYCQYPLKENFPWKSKWSNFIRWNWRHLKGDINFSEWSFSIRFSRKIFFKRKLTLNLTVKSMYRVITKKSSIHVVILFLIHFVPYTLENT